MLNFSSNGPPLTPAALNRFLSEYGVALPDEVRGFLLEHNGGGLDPPMAFDWREDQWEVESFLSITPRDDWDGVRRELDTLLESGIDCCFPLIWTLTGGVIGVDTRDGAGRLIYFERESNLWTEEEEDLGPHLVAKDFPTFLSMLYENPDPYCRVRDIAKNGTADDVERYLADGNGIDALGVYKNTLLYEASNFGNLGVIRACVAHGASLKNVLHTAASSADIPAVRLLVELGADINATDDRGFTPIECVGGTLLPGEHGAANRAIRKVLLEYGAIDPKQ